MQNQAVQKSELGQCSLPELSEINGKHISANGLRSGIYKALSKVPFRERVRLYKKLIGDLESARIRVGSRLFLLGITANVPEELTPSDIGKLIRSVYLNEPQAIAAASQTLNEILLRNDGPKANNRTSSTQTNRK